MKNLAIYIFVCTVLSACTFSAPSTPTGTGTPVPTVAYPTSITDNPATTYCMKNGGIPKAQGATTYCVLPDGTQVDVWKYMSDSTTVDTKKPSTGATTTGTTVSTPALVPAAKLMSGSTATTDTPTTPVPTTKKTTYTLAEVAVHGTDLDCYTAISGKVYDVTAFFGEHPGGDKNLLRVCGIDATTVFSQKHGKDENAIGALADFQIGTLGK